MFGKTKQKRSRLLLGMLWLAWLASCEAPADSLWVQTQAGLFVGTDWDQDTQAWLGIAYAELGSNTTSHRLEEIQTM